MFVIYEVFCQVFANDFEKIELLDKTINILRKTTNFHYAFSAHYPNCLFCFSCQDDGIKTGLNVNFKINKNHPRHGREVMLIFCHRKYLNVNSF